MRTLSSPMPPPGAAGGGAIGKAVLVAARWGATPTPAEPDGAPTAAAASDMARVVCEGDAIAEGASCPDGMGTDDRRRVGKRPAIVCPTNMHCVCDLLRVAFRELGITAGTRSMLVAAIKLAEAAAPLYCNLCQSTLAS